VLKAGFVNFGLSDEPVTGGTIISSFQNLREDDMNFSLFPGVGVELFLGPVGVRLDVGDQIYWSDGARHNLKITFGPHFQF
jgi:hypothetical protein